MSDVPDAETGPARDATPTSGAGRETSRLPFVYEASTELILDAPAGATPTRVLLAIHGRGQEPRRLLPFLRSVAPDALLVLPRGPSTYQRAPTRPGATPRPGPAWITRRRRAAEDRRNTALLDAALDTVRGRFAVEAARTHVLGYSQGAGVALHWLTSRPEGALGLVGLAGGFAEAYRARLSALRGRPLLWVSGSRDPAYPIAYTDTLVDAFREADVRLHAIRLDAGHDLLEPAREGVARWLEMLGPDSPKSA